MTFFSRAAIMLTARQKLRATRFLPLNGRRPEPVGKPGYFIALAFGLMLALASQGISWCQALPPTTPEIFRQFSEHVVKIEVVETGSAAKASIGTGFFATATGHIITNYHVVSKLIHSPERYRIEVTGAAGRTNQAIVMAVDVIYDLAVLRGAAQAKGFLKFEPARIQQGTRLYSLGRKTRVRSVQISWRCRADSEPWRRILALGN